MCNIMNSAKSTIDYKFIAAVAVLIAPMIYVVYPELIKSLVTDRVDSYTLNGVGFNMTRQEVEFRLGPPVQSLKKDGNLLTQHLISGRMVEVYYTSEELVTGIGLPCKDGVSATRLIHGIDSGTEEKVAINTLGNPDVITYSSDNEYKMIGYHDLSTTFILRRGTVCGMIVTNDGVVWHYVKK